MEIQPLKNTDSSDDFTDFIASELQQTRATLKEITTKVDQSQGELNRLTQKKATVTAQLMKIQTDSEQVSRQDIRNAFNEAMDSQQRLLVMRGQLDKLQEQQNNLQDFKKHLERAQEFLQTHSFKATNGKNLQGGVPTLEMLITAQESERQRLSRQMHDGPAQALSNFIVQAEITTRLFDMDPIKAKDELEKLKNSAMNTFQKVRSFISELRPMMLDDLGLVPTLKRHVSNLKEQTGVEISIDINGSEKKLEPYLEVYIFRAAQELIGNSIKHNLDNASKIKIDTILSLDSSQASVIIKDNGKGFNIDELEDSSGLGLKLIKERAEMLGGSLEIKSSPTAGSEITLTIPVVDMPIP